MQRPCPSTYPRSGGFVAREQAGLDAQAWLERRLRWENRLTDLRALAAGGDTARRVETRQRAVRARSGVLEPQERSAGVCA